VLLGKEMIAAFGVVLICAIGFSALLLGYCVSWLLHQPWSGWTAVADAGTAIGTAMLSAVLMTIMRLEASLGPIWPSGLALLSVVVRHAAIRLAARGSSDPAA